MKPRKHCLSLTPLKLTHLPFVTHLPFISLPFSYHPSLPPLQMAKYGDPTFPSIATVPSNSVIVSNIHFIDYVNTALLTAASYGLGFVGGKPVRVPSALMGASIGLTGGFCLAYQNSFQRFKGFRDNSKEVAKYGTAASRLVHANYMKLDDKERMLNYERFADPFVSVADVPVTGVETE